MHTRDVIDLTAATMTVEEAAEYLGISRTMAYSEATRYRRSEGAVGLPNLKFGGRVLVITTLLVELLTARTNALVDRPDLSQLQAS
jgi:hypothetical protein